MTGRGLGARQLCALEAIFRDCSISFGLARIPFMLK
jgi:hypothetical protein